jgi:hypothetical protein
MYDQLCVSCPDQTRVASYRLYCYYVWQRAALAATNVLRATQGRALSPQWRPLPWQILSGCWTPLCTSRSTATASCWWSLSAIALTRPTTTTNLYVATCYQYKTCIHYCLLGTISQPLVICYQYKTCIHYCLWGTISHTLVICYQYKTCVHYCLWGTISHTLVICYQYKTCVHYCLFGTISQPLVIVKAKLCLCLTNQALRHEVEWRVSV